MTPTTRRRKRRGTMARDPHSRRAQLERARHGRDLLATLERATSYTVGQARTVRDYLAYIISPNENSANSIYPRVMRDAVALAIDVLEGVAAGTVDVGSTREREAISDARAKLARVRA